MGGCRCSYRNCANTTKTRENLHFFHYPVKHKERCRLWIENARKQQFYNLDEDQLRNKVVCETHFEDHYFPNSQKKRLLQGAIPTLDGDCDDYPLKDSKLNVNQDIQILPANDEGTIFILETNKTPNDFQSNKVESYIYTNNGMVLPVEKFNDISEVYGFNEVSVPKTKNYAEQKPDILAESCDSVFDDFVYSPNSFPKYINNISTNTQPQPQTKQPQLPNQQHQQQPPQLQQQQQVQQPQQQQQQLQKQPKSPQTSKKLTTNATIIYDDLPECISEIIENKYGKKINQHSKDIASLKNLFKFKRTIRKPSKGMLLRLLKKHLPSTLISLIDINLNKTKSNLSSNDNEFYNDIYKTSPEMYQLLMERYKWNLPKLNKL